MVQNGNQGFGGLVGKRVVVLGGTSGFGLATAQLAAKEGAEVVVVSSRQARVDEALATLPEGSLGWAVDLGSEDQIRELFEEVGEFDHLVFTAGDSLHQGELADIDFSEAQKYFGVRFWGAFMAAKFGGKKIRAGGSITLTSGIVSMRPRKGWSIGSTVTAATESLARALAVELAPIRVNAVCAGVVRTNLWSGMPEAEREALFQSEGASLPVGHVGEPEDLAQAYLFLMRERFCTGQVIVVDGGATIV